MWWFIFLYILPGMATTWLLPKFVAYQEGLAEAIQQDLPDDFDYDGTLRVLGFVPIINVILAVPLIVWYVHETTNKTDCGD